MSPIALQSLLVPSWTISPLLPTAFMAVATATQTSRSNSAITLPPAPSWGVASVLPLINILLMLVRNSAIPRPLMHQVIALLLIPIHNSAILRHGPLVHQVLRAVAPGVSRNTTTSLKFMEIPAPPHDSPVVSQLLRPVPPAFIPLSLSMSSIPRVCRPPHEAALHPCPLVTLF
jgi:hypothetical protein